MTLPPIRTEKYWWVPAGASQHAAAACIVRPDPATVAGSVALFPRITD